MFKCINSKYRGDQSKPITIEQLKLKLSDVFLIGRVITEKAPN